MKLLVCFILALASLTAADDPPQSGTWSRFGIATPTAESKTRCVSCVRDARGRIVRSAAARRQFQRDNPCPATGLTRGACPGYIVDHIVALKQGGRDEPGNMQWQTVEQAKAKDRAE